MFNARNNPYGTKPLLISRITELSPLQTRSSITEPSSPLPSRKGSLNHFWATFTSEVRSAKPHPLDFVDLDVLDVEHAEWVSARAHFENGVLSFSHGSDSPFASIKLSGLRIVGHMAKAYIQILNDNQTFLLHMDSHESNVKCLATLLAWSETRDRGIQNKAWTPKAQFGTVQSGEKEELLVCKFNVHFTAPHASDSSSWQTVLGTLDKKGRMSLSVDRGEIFALDITQIYADCIRRVDPSLVSSEWVIFIVPDMGGPESVYLKFSTDNDFEDWFVCVRGFCKQTVHTPLTRDVSQSIRFSHLFKVNILSGKTKGPDDTQAFFDFSNTYVDICFNDWIWARTSVHPSANDPFWGQEFVFKELDRDLAPLELVLRRTNTDRPSELDLFLAKVIIDNSDAGTERWVTLEADENTDVSISLYISFEHVKTPVLDSACYDGMQSILRKPSNFDIATTLVGSSSKLVMPTCELFTDIYRGEFMHTEWMTSLISSEVSSLAKENTKATGTDVLFRGSSLLSQALEKFMFLYGRDTLVKTVGRFVRKICASKDQLELDPSKINGASDAEVGAIAKVNRLAFEHYLNYLWSLIKNHSLPETVQYLMTHLRKEMQEKLQATDAQVWNGLAAFIFLRFYCPAILNPRLFGLADQTLTSGNQRALTLFAKILQSFANRVKMGSKQDWLLHMNRFFESHDAELVAYYKKASSWTSDMPLARVPKQLPLKSFMGASLTNPYLVDLPASYARLADWIANNIEFNKDWDHATRLLYEESKKVSNQLRDVYAVLEEPDPLPTQPGDPVTLYANWTSMLYSPDSSLLDSHLVKAPEKKSLFRLFRRG